MRVVAGEAKGRRLVAPRGTATRPTSDAVREAIFGSIGSILDLDGATVLDLFAGTGALGIEALSRGAARATFVERDRVALDALRANLRATGFAGRAEVVAGDVLSVRPTWPAVDLALADPPYAFDAWDVLLLRIDAPLVVAESDRELVAPEGWRVRRARRYGGTVVNLLSPGA